MIFDREVVDDQGQRQRLKVGVIGFVPPQIMQWDQGHLAGKVTTTDIVDAALKYVPELARQTDIVLALCHSGIEGGERRGRRGERRASPGEGARDRRDLHGPPAQGVSRQGLRRHPGRRCREGHAARRSGRDGRLLGQPSRHHRPRAREGRRHLEGPRVAQRGAAPSTTARTARSFPRWRTTRPRRRR